MATPQDFEAIKLKLASPDQILAWSYGEVKKPETINYRTQRPEKEGLFSERIFGPTKDWECYCGKYKRIRFKGITCDKCGVEVTRSIVRRERMGHITLAAPVSHIWFLRGVPSKVGMMLDISVRQLEKVVYFASYLVTSVDEDAKQEAAQELEEEYKATKKEIRDQSKTLLKEAKDAHAAAVADGAKKKSADTDLAKVEKRIEADEDKNMKDLEEAFAKEQSDLKGVEKLRILSELEYRELSDKYGHVFQAGIGAESLRKVLEEIDVDDMIEELREAVEQATVAQRRKIERRLNLFLSMKKAGIRPEWSILTVLPIIPPDLRPMVQLDGGRFAASDLNDLYRRVINRNNRLKRLLELNAPEVITRNEKRMLQESVDALIDNGARASKAATATTGQKRALRSLADLLKGKQGRFRQNLLGKRVDYSGRSVIVVGPQLKLNEVGIPKTMALELFKPFVIQKLIRREVVHNVRSASKLIDERESVVWDVLEEVIQGHYVLLNRAPTLHRLGIQAFQPILIEGKAIHLHPMVCTAFNADFDGDQMAVHVPLTFMARKEAREIMSASKNLLRPATGQPIATATKDMVLGCYFITREKKGALGEGKIFSSEDEALYASQVGAVDLRAKVHVRIKEGDLIETTVGRVIFNQLLPDELRYVNEVTNKKVMARILADAFEQLGEEAAVQLIDGFKDLGFQHLTKSGISWSMNDLRIPEQKQEMLDEAAAEVETIRQQFKQGLLTDNERYARVIETWAGVKDKITDLSKDALDPTGAVYQMVDSGARGSWPQLVQMTGMRGLMAAPSGRTIELPVLDSFKEGLGVLEYFISTHGARKGQSDTALRTANAGYLTRRLIDVSQDIIVLEDDCGDEEGISINREDSAAMQTTIAQRILGRYLAQDVKDGTKVIAKAGEDVTVEAMEAIAKLDPDEVIMRSVLSCRLTKGVCRKCYGWDLGHNKPVELGTAVGIIAAQSIGEPGTQLTMRTFHTGGVASADDITQGLPRVEELFEARNIKKPAVVAQVDGVVSIERNDDHQVLRITPSGSEKDTYEIEEGFKVKPKDGGMVKKGAVLLTKGRKNIVAENAGQVKVGTKNIHVILPSSIEQIEELPHDAPLRVKDGDLVVAGLQLTEGHVDLQQLFEVAGRRAVQRYILRDVQEIYSSQGQDINDKHVEIIIRQMLQRVRVTKSGDSDFNTGQIVSRVAFQKAIEDLEALKGKKELPEAEDMLLGITKASLTTDSFLSSASFQETARVLIDAAITGREDNLVGLKENVIIGKLIPAGTGFDSSFAAEAREEAAEQLALDRERDEEMVSATPSYDEDGNLLPPEEFALEEGDLPGLVEEVTSAGTSTDDEEDRAIEV